MYDRICFLNDNRVTALYIELPDNLHEIPGLVRSLSEKIFIDSFSMYLNNITGFSLLKQIESETLIAFKTGFGANGFADDEVLLVVEYKNIKRFNDELDIPSFMMNNTNIGTKKDLVWIAEENKSILFIDNSYHTPVLYSICTDEEIQNKMIEAK